MPIYHPICNVRVPVGPAFLSQLLLMLCQLVYICIYTGIDADTCRLSVSVCVSVSVCLSASLPLCLSATLLLCLSLCLSVSLSVSLSVRLVLSCPAPSCLVVSCRVVSCRITCLVVLCPVSVLAVMVCSVFVCMHVSIRGIRMYVGRQVGRQACSKADK